MLLRATRRYRSAGYYLEPGEVVEVDETEAARLERDSPGTFTRANRHSRAVDAPPVHRMVQREQATRKDRGGGEPMTRANARGVVRD